MYVYVFIIGCMLYSASVASQVYKAFCFDSIVCGHHVYKTVWALQKAGEFVGCSLLIYHGSGHSQSFAPCLALAAVIAVPLLVILTH